MSNVLLLNQPFVCEGLGSFTFTIPSAGLYSVMVQLTENPPSGCTVAVTQNASLKYTSPVITPTQIAQQFKTLLSCAAADAIVVTLSSGLPIDAKMNNVKWTCTVEQGM